MSDTSPLAGYGVFYSSAGGQYGEYGQPLEITVVLLFNTAPADYSPSADALAATVSWGDGATSPLTLASQGLVLVGQPYEIDGAGVPAWSATATHHYRTSGTYTLNVSGGAGSLVVPATYTANAPALDPFASEEPSPLTPFANGSVVVPNDNADLLQVAQGLYVPVGFVKVTTVGGSVLVLPAANFIWNVRVSRVWQTGTSSAGVLAFW